MNSAYESFLRKVAADWERAGGRGATDFLDYAKRVADTAPLPMEPDVMEYGRAAGEHVIDYVDRGGLENVGFDPVKLGAALDDVLEQTSSYIYDSIGAVGIDYGEAMADAIKRAGIDPDAVRLDDGDEQGRAPRALADVRDEKSADAAAQAGKDVGAIEDRSGTER